MYRILLFFILVAFNNHAQIDKVSEEVYPIFPICKLIPNEKQNQCFDESMFEHVEKNFKYPKTAWELDLESLVRIRFEIDELGEVDNIIANSSVVGISFIEKEALKAAESMFEVAAANIIRSLPKMTPAKKNGEPFRKTFQISVEYRIPDQLDYDEIDIAPRFPDCNDVEPEKSKECFENYITNHINKNLKYPKRAMKNNIEGDVFIQFEITKDGYFINFSTIGPNKILEDEAYRIMVKLPQVKAGEYLGKKVSVLYGLPISFRLN